MLIVLVLQEYLEYHRYLREVVEALESDPDFKAQLEKADEDDMRVRNYNSTPPKYLQERERVFKAKDRIVTYHRVRKRQNGFFCRNVSEFCSSKTAEPKKQ